ncbi:efflux RND transporter periplasmic adaptor subunit [Pseudomonas aeruginosa]
MIRHARRRWSLSFAVGLPAMACFALAGCDSHDTEAALAMPAPEVSVAPVLMRSVQQWDTFNGRIEAVQSVEVRPRVSGTVDRVAFTDGQEVQRGDLLFVIDQRPYHAALAAVQAQLERAKAAAQLAQTHAQRAKALIAENAISREEFDNRMADQVQSRAEVRAATAAVATARLNLEFTEVRAPIAGRASRALLTHGNLAQADQSLLTTLVSQDPVQVYFEPDEQSYLRYLELARSGTRTGSSQTVRLALANESGFPHQGQLDFMDNRVDPATGTIRARAVLPNPDRRFTPGLYARVQLDGGTLPEAMLIDGRAVLTDQDRMYVYTLAPDHKVVRKDVQLGTSVGRLRVVRSGLTRGDDVVIDGIQKILYPGMAVQPVKVAMEPVTAKPVPLATPAAQRVGK